VKLFRRKSFSEIHAADIEAARVAASGLGGYRFDVVATQLAGFPYTSGHMTSPAVESAQSPRAKTPAAEDTPRCANPGQERTRSGGFPPPECRCGGHIGWIDRGDHWEGTCHGPCKMPHFRSKQREPHSIAEFAETIDTLQQENEALHRENKRLRSELNQAVAQRDIARSQRDEARAAATNGRMSP
jgi:hypothetical protein